MKREEREERRVDDRRREEGGERGEESRREQRGGGGPRVGRCMQPREERARRRRQTHPIEQQTAKFEAAKALQSTTEILLSFGPKFKGSGLRLENSWD